MRSESPEVWQDAQQAAALLAVAPDQLGGLVLHALPGPVRETWLKRFNALFPKSVPMRRLPNHAGEARLVGGLDLAATLSAGRPVAERGLLADAHGGVVIIPMAERLEPLPVACITAALDRGEVHRQRDGISGTDPACFAVLALDESLEGDDPLPAALTDRLAFLLDLSALSHKETGGRWISQKTIKAARACLADVTVSDSDIEHLCAMSLVLGVSSARAPQFALWAARAAAALAGRAAVSSEDLDLAARLVLGPRATQMPQPEAEQDPQDTAPDQKDMKDDSPSHPQNAPMEDDVIDAAEAAIPRGLLEALSRGQTRRSGGAGSRAGKLTASKTKGRPIGTQFGDPRRGGRLHVLSTLRAAAPWQAVRRRMQPDVDTPVRLEKSDFRLTRFKHRQRTVTVFVVDASGSAARQRLAEAKGAVELLLAECYVRRDEVALITFKGEQAELVLPPTRSLVRAKRTLAGLPGGGGTPLAAALHSARQLADSIKRAGQTPAVVLLTDAGANITLDGQADRSAARAEAETAAQLLRSEDVPTILLDTSPRPRDRARDLAQHLGAAYCPLPQVDAKSVSAATQDFMKSAAHV